MRLLACLLLVPLMAVAAGPQWKWRDASGQVQYSDRPPPPGIPDRDILQRPVVKAKPIQIISADAPASAAAKAPPAPPASAPAAEKKKAEEAQKEKAEKAKQAAAEAENRRRKAENCEQARARLAEIDSGQRLSSINAQGERVFWDDARRAAERQRVQQIAADSCR